MMRSIRISMIGGCLLQAGCSQSPLQELHRVEIACLADKAIQPVMVDVVIDFAPYGGLIGGIDNMAIHPAIEAECARLEAKYISAVVIE